MKLSLFNSQHHQDVIELFIEAFSKSESEKEGALIGNLVSEIILQTTPEDLIGCVASLDRRIVGSIFFSRFAVPSGQSAFLLSPVAVSTNQQGKGIGQSLITFGIEYLKSLEVELLFTYGDPDFYQKTGFDRISTSIVQPPFKLSQPEGWLAQSLDGSPVNVMKGATRCVEAFNNQMYW